MCSLKRHKEHIHQRRENEVPICSICGNDFISIDYLEMHEKKMYKSVSPLWNTCQNKEGTVVPKQKTSDFEFFG